MRGGAGTPKSGSMYTEQDWNETSTVDNGEAYHLSKASPRFHLHLCNGREGLPSHRAVA